MLDGSVEDAKRAAKGAADNVLSHLDSGKRAALVAQLKPWWRPIPAGSFDMGGDEDSDGKPIHRVTFTSGFQIHKDSLVAVTVAGQPTRTFTYFGDYNVNAPVAGSAKIKAWGRRRFFLRLFGDHRAGDGALLRLGARQGRARAGRHLPGAAALGSFRRGL